MSTELRCAHNDAPHPHRTGAVVARVEGACIWTPKQRRQAWDDEGCLGVQQVAGERVTDLGAELAPVTVATCPKCGRAYRLALRDWASMAAGEWTPLTATVALCTSPQMR